jgi:hypothetical protein
MTETATTPWQVPACEPSYLRFQVSYRTLWRVGFPVARRGFSLAECRAGEARVDPSRDSNESGVLYRSAVLDRDDDASRAPWLTYVQARYPRYYVDLQGTFDEYSTVRRKLRAFASLSGGQIDVRRYRTVEEVADFHQRARELSTRTYQERVLDVGLPAGDDFREALLARAAADQVRAWLLMHAGAAVSYLYLHEQDGNLVYAYVGYDPEYAQHSVGTVLQWLALEDLFAEGRFRGRRQLSWPVGDNYPVRCDGVLSVICVC